MVINNIIPSHVKELEKSEDWEKEYSPVIKDKDGTIIDGNHRKAADSNWKEVISKKHLTPIQKVRLQIKLNLIRRDVSIEEKQGWVKEVEEELKKQGENYGKDSIGKLLGVTSKTIFNWKGGTKSPPSIPTLDDRKITPYGDNMFYLSEINNKASRNDAYYVIKEGEPYPTLKRRSWFFHEDGREFSLREYAKVQDFPDNFLFIGTKEKIKDQIGNAVSPKMAEFIAKDIPKGSAIELFAGCGGMSLGFENKGHKVLWMNEFNLMACRTYHANFPKVIVDARPIEDVSINEIKKAIGNQEINLIFGGPPCQGFSLSGVGFKDDNRNKLYKEFIRVVKGIKPKYFIMENVKGILPFKDEIVKDFEKVGYNVEVKIIKGEEIGMQQKRNRVFFIGKCL